MEDSPRYRGAGRTGVGFGPPVCLVAAVASAGVATLTTVMSSRSGWETTHLIVATGAWVLTGLAVREVIRKTNRQSVVLTVALVEVAILMPLQDNGVQWTSLVTLGLAMGGRLVLSGDLKAERRFLTMAGAVWLSSVAWRIFPLMGWSGEIDEVTREAFLWLGVYLVGRATRAVRLNEQRYRGLFDGAPIGLLEEDFTAVGSWLESLPVTSADQLRDHLSRHPDEVKAALATIEIGAVNPAALAIFGAESREVYLHEKPKRSAASHSVTAAFIEQFVAIWEHRQGLDIAFMGTKVNGDAFPARLGSCFPTAPEGGLDLAHGVVAITDISPLMKALESNEHLLAGVSQRLRTPLTGVMGFTRELLETPQLLAEDERVQLLTIVADEADSMARIVDDLLIAARSDMSQLMMRMTPIALAPYLAALRAKWHVAGKRLRFQDCDLTVCADPARIGQILRILVDNAVAHGGDEITIEAGAANGPPVITVSDDGPGVAEDQAEAIFEPYLGIGSNPGQPKPLGLGLTIARKLARAMGGDLTYRRRNGRTEFLLLLPSPEAMPPSREPALTACPGCDRSGACTWSLGSAGTPTIARCELARPAA